MAAGNRGLFFGGGLAGWLAPAPAVFESRIPGLRCGRDDAAGVGRRVTAESWGLARFSFLNLESCASGSWERGLVRVGAVCIAMRKYFACQFCTEGPESIKIDDMKAHSHHLLVSTRAGPAGIGRGGHGGADGAIACRGAADARGRVESIGMALDAGGSSAADRFARGENARKSGHAMSLSKRIGTRYFPQSAKRISGDAP